MTETEFPWGTVTHEIDRESGTTQIDMVVETDDDVSVSATTASDETAEPTDPGAETDRFSWGTVAYATDSGTTEVEVFIDDADDVSLAVTSVSENGSETSTSIVTIAGEDGEGGDVSVSQSTSTTASTGESVEIDINDGTEDE